LQQGDVGPVPQVFEAVVMTVESAVEHDIKFLGPKAAESALAATALALARELDGENSATSKSMCAKALIDTMRELRAVSPPKMEADGLDDLTARREARRSASTAAARP
jgi:hypothetical protein